MATKAAEHLAGSHDFATQQIKNFDNLRNILKNARHSSGHDLYQHLVEVMNHIVMHCPDNGLDKFEEISYLLKLLRDGKIENLSDFLEVTDDRSYCKPGKEAHADLTAKYLQKAKVFFNVTHTTLNLPLKRFYRRKQVSKLREPKAVTMVPLTEELMQALAALCQIYLLTLEYSNGEALASVTMKRFYFKSL